MSTLVRSPVQEYVVSSQLQSFMHAAATVASGKNHVQASRPGTHYTRIDQV
eukprot:NODE_8439_length_1495_cov_10.301901.p10 GENE.NODE_8439_length_1495_cov_10.301901~~NODE_8439_length_1495_cov_10.301901.p10  ORF type:complete len:51 (+),score=4.63 NODE_8439_length_1495_cov_10.301901:785-937(+)